MSVKKVLTTIPCVSGGFWGTVSDLAHPLCEKVMYGKLSRPAKLACSFFITARMLMARRKYDAAVVEGDSMGILFAMAQSVLPGRALPTVMVDCLWYRHPSPFMRWLKRLQLQTAARSVDRFVVWAKHEVRDYAREFGIPEHKFVFLPFHNTVDRYSFQVRDNGYVFSGGNGDRDYSVLLDAVRGTDIPVFIASTACHLFEGLDIPSNVTLRGVSPQKFRELLAGCTVNVVCMQDGLLHSGGQQTLINSMCLGKPTIVVGPRAAEGYLQDGVNGFVIGHGDSSALRQRLNDLWGDASLRNALAGNAARATGAHATDSCMKAIYEMSGQAALKRSSPHAGRERSAGGL